MSRSILYVSREKELEVIQKLETIIDTRDFSVEDTVIVQASVEYAGPAVTYFAHAWSIKGEPIKIIPVEVAYPDESYDYVRKKFQYDMHWHLSHHKYKKFIVIEAGIIRGGNWKWILEEFELLNVSRKNVKLVALYENIHSIVKSDYVGEYYDNDKHDLTFYFEKYNKHWPTL